MLSRSEARKVLAGILPFSLFARGAQSTEGRADEGQHRRRQTGSTPTAQRLRANRQFNRVTERHRFRSLEKVLARWA
jgi:hypothetical protein